MSVELTPLKCGPGVVYHTRCTNASVLRKLKIENGQRLSSPCMQRVVRYFGHVTRKDADNLEHLLLTGKVEGKRSVEFKTMFRSVV